MGERVLLMNPRNVRQKVAFGTVSGLAREHKIHGKDILAVWFRVNVEEVHLPNSPLMWPHADDKMQVVKDIVGSTIGWEERFMRSVS